MASIHQATRGLSLWCSSGGRVRARDAFPVSNQAVCEHVPNPSDVTGVCVSPCREGAPAIALPRRPLSVRRGTRGRPAVAG